MTNLERLLQELCPGECHTELLVKLQQIFFVERVLPVNRFVKKEHLAYVMEKFIQLMAYGLINVFPTQMRPC